SLINLLKRLLKQGSIAGEFFNMTSPKGSNLGRLYGLTKVHKDNLPSRPVLSAIGTFSYGLGKALTQMLSNIIEKRTLFKIHLQ
ncbi:unnamed protein product, partial [Rotaria magnacalcarata]